MPPPLLPRVNPAPASDRPEIKETDATTLCRTTRYARPASSEPSSYCERGRRSRSAIRTPRAKSHLKTHLHDCTFEGAIPASFKLGSERNRPSRPFIRKNPTAIPRCPAASAARAHTGFLRTAVPGVRLHRETLARRVEMAGDSEAQGVAGAAGATLTAPISCSARTRASSSGVVSRADSSRRGFFVADMV